MIISDDKYLLGILNSSLSKFQLINICDKVQGGFYRLKIIYIEQLRILIPRSGKERKLQSQIINEVETILKSHNILKLEKLPTNIQQIKTRIAHSEEKIDQLVYELYQLTPEEIKIVEGK